MAKKKPEAGHKPAHRPQMAVRKTDEEKKQAEAEVSRARAADNEPEDEGNKAQPGTPAGGGKAKGGSEEAGANDRAGRVKASNDPEAARKAKTRRGHLYSVQNRELILQKPKPSAPDEPSGDPGEAVELAEGCTVTVNDTETECDDLKRGDVVTLTGDPVTEIAATR